MLTNLILSRRAQDPEAEILQIFTLLMKNYPGHKQACFSFYQNIEYLKRLQRLSRDTYNFERFRNELLYRPHSLIGIGPITPSLLWSHQPWLDLIDLVRTLPEDSQVIFFTPHHPELVAQLKEQSYGLSQDAILYVQGSNRRNPTARRKEDARNILHMMEPA